MNFQGRIYKRCRRILVIPLVALLCFSLVGMGCLFWVDNAWVYIKGGGAEDAGRAKLFDLPLADGLDYDEIQALDPDGDGVIPLADGYLIRGNGNQDDNKEEAFFFQSPAGIMAAMPPIMRAVTNFRERRIVAAYKDFGHLKVMPAADAVSLNENQTFQIMKGYSYGAGKPFVFYTGFSNGLHIYSINVCHYKTIADI